jgi:hypothetical protein
VVYGYAATSTLTIVQIARQMPRLLPACRDARREREAAAWPADAR